MDDGAPYGERGGTLPASTPLANPKANRKGESTVSTNLDTSSSTSPHSLSFARPPAPQSSTSGMSADTFASVKPDLVNPGSVARQELLRESLFPTWSDDAAAGGIESPDEMQKKDPLAAQIWKLYSRTKTQLPNQERVENLTWRMMAMSLRRKEREQLR